MRETKRVLLATLVFLVVGLLAGSPAAFAQYPPTTGRAGVNDSQVPPGGDLTVSGSGWLGGSFVDLQFQSAPVDLGIASVNAQGTFQKTVTIPSDATPGAHSVRVSGTASNGQSDTVFIPIQILGAGAGGGAGVGGGGDAGAVTIPFTGIVLRRWMLLIGGLTLLGSVALFAGRRRARAH